MVKGNINGMSHFNLEFSNFGDVGGGEESTKYLACTDLSNWMMVKSEWTQL